MPAMGNQELEELDGQIEELNRRIARRNVEISNTRHNPRQSRDARQRDVAWMEIELTELEMDRGTLQAHRNALMEPEQG